VSHSEFERDPFPDGNSRIGRLLLNLLLLRLGYAPAIIYLRDRRRYLSALRAADGAVVVDTEQESDHMARLGQVDVEREVRRICCEPDGLCIWGGRQGAPGRQAELASGCWDSGEPPLRRTRPISDLVAYPLG
jgi:hypothetical protein